MKRVFSFFLALVTIFSIHTTGLATESKGIVSESAASYVKEDSSVNPSKQRDIIITIGGGSPTTEEMISFKITGKENYDYASSVLTKLNKIREKVGAPKIKMDKELLEVAMQRAAECAISFSHTRPDNTSCFTAAPSGCYAMGENIAMGQYTPDEVIQSWKDSQGHYENMIDPDYNAVGIGCFQATDGTLCWVQFFANKTVEKVSKKGSVKNTRKITAEAGNLTLSLGVDYGVTNNCAVNDTFDFIVTNNNMGFVIQQIPSKYFVYSSSNTDVIAIKDQKNGVAKGEGTAKITAKGKDNKKVKFSEKITLEHVHSGKVLSKTEKTSGCKKTVTKKYKCKKCDYIYTRKTVTKHTSTKWVVDKKATVYESGKKHKECKKCGKIIETVKINQKKCSAPKIYELINTGEGVKIDWGKVRGADLYKVYRKNNDDKWECIGATKNSVFTDKKAKSGKKYIYAVKAKNEAGDSPISKTHTKYYLAEPSLERPASTETGIKLKWSKVTGADGYVIYCKTGSGSYETLATLRGKSKVSYKHKSAKKGTKYTYKIRAYYGNTLSGQSNTRTITDKY